MKEFMKMAGAVTVGTLMASGIAVSMLLNKKFLTAYTKKVMAVGVKVQEEMDDYEN